MPQKLHIISFDIPCSPLYGGIIDVYYKIVALHNEGVEIKLHCFEYGNSKSINEIKPYCNEIYLYPRKSFLSSVFSSLPHIVVSRSNDELLNNLLKDENPILMEGIHSTFLLTHPALQKRKIIVWNHNIEYDYYSMLAKASKNIAYKLYYWLESIKLKNYQSNLKSANIIISVSQKDAITLLENFKQTVYIPAFNQQKSVKSLAGKGDYLIYHGNLSVEENEIAILWLIEKVWSKLNYHVIIAGKNPTQRIIDAIKPYSQITLKSNISQNEMNELQINAQIHCLITFQDTGIKHKLLNALYIGRFVLTNNLMVNGTGLENLVILANTPLELISKIHLLMMNSFDEVNIQKRKTILYCEFNNQVNAKKLMELIKN